MIKINRPPCPNIRALRTNYKHPDNKDVLINASSGKCMYCESKIIDVYFGDVEHIKPKEKYPQLKFEWSNLGFVCAKCNNAKNDKYEEMTPYINPYEERPDQFFIVWGPLIRSKMGNERSELTILDVALNRVSLLESRSEKIKSIEKAINACFRCQDPRLKQVALEELLEECSDDKEYSFFINALLKAHDLVS